MNFAGPAVDQDGIITLFGWAVSHNASEHHVLPLGDTYPHKPVDCWCQPTQDPDEPRLWVHNAHDQRERHEMGFRRLQ